MGRLSYTIQVEVEYCIRAWGIGSRIWVALFTWLLLVFVSHSTDKGVVDLGLMGIQVISGCEVVVGIGHCEHQSCHISPSVNSCVLPM